VPIYWGAEAGRLIYEVVVGTEPEESVYVNLSYEDVLRIFIDRLISEEQAPLTVRRRCCSSVHKQTMSVETCEAIRELAGITGEKEGKRNEDPADIRKKLDAAVNNWYLRGKVSLSDEGLVRPVDDCPVG